MSLSATVKSTIKKPLDSLAAKFGPHRKKGSSKLWILMYHRILPKSDPLYAQEEPGMIVEPETFRQHIKQLKQFFTIMPLSEWVDRQKAGRSLPANCCAITFDDGWADNFHYALPIIQQEQVPTTLFAVSDMIGTHQAFWPNRLSKLLNDAPIDQLFELNWLAPFLTSIEPPNPVLSEKKLSAHTADQLSHIIQQLKIFPDNTIIEWLDDAENRLKIKPNSANQLVDWPQLKAMSDSGLVEIGSHTCNHFRLQNSLDSSILQQEIIQSQRRLQEELNKPVTLFCYPNGDTSPEALGLVSKYYKAAVTTHRGINSSSGIELNQLKRIGMHQDISDTRTRFESRLANWF